MWCRKWGMWQSREYRLSPLLPIQECLRWLFWTKITILGKKSSQKNHNNNKKKQTNKQNSTNPKQGRQGKEQVFQFQEKSFLGKFLSNIIRLETEMGRALKNFRIITRETPFSHKMKGTSTVYELICVAYHYPCRKLFQIYGLESFSANFPSASCQPSWPLLPLLLWVLFSFSVSFRRCDGHNRIQCETK